MLAQQKIQQNLKQCMSKLRTLCETGQNTKRAATNVAAKSWVLKALQKLQSIDAAQLQYTALHVCTASTT